MPHTLSRLLLVILTAAMCGVGGCAANRATANDYNQLFAQHRYADSYDAAAKVAGSMNSIHRDQASLVAGLSARALDRTADAKKWLVPVSGNANSNIAGQASAALGAIAQEEHRHREAVEFFTNAATRLKGDDAARALMFAGDSLRGLSLPAKATETYKKAQTLVVSDNSLRVSLADRLSGGGPALVPAAVGTPKISPTGKYTLQLGAFSSIKKAKTEAKKLLDAGATRTVPIRDKTGRTLYAVQFGRYATKQDAEAARRAVAPTAFVTMYN